MKYIWIFLAVMVLGGFAQAGIVNNSETSETEADSIVIPFYLLDSAGYNTVLLASTDTIFITVWYPSGLASPGIAWEDSIPQGNARIRADAVSTDIGQYALILQVSDIDGTAQQGTYRYTVIVDDESLDLQTTFWGEFQLYTKTDYNLWADHLYDSLQATIDSLQLLDEKFTALRDSINLVHAEIDTELDNIVEAFDDDGVLVDLELSQLRIIAPNTQDTAVIIIAEDVGQGVYIQGGDLGSATAGQGILVNAPSTGADAVSFIGSGNALQLESSAIAGMRVVGATQGVRLEAGSSDAFWMTSTSGHGIGFSTLGGDPIQYVSDTLSATLAEVLNLDGWNPITDNDSLIMDASDGGPKFGLAGWNVSATTAFTSGSMGDSAIGAANGWGATAAGADASPSGWDAADSAVVQGTVWKSDTGVYNGVAGSFGKLLYDSLIVDGSALAATSGAITSTTMATSSIDASAVDALVYDGFWEYLSSNVTVTGGMGYKLRDSLGDIYAEVLNIDAWNPITDNDSLIVDASDGGPKFGLATWNTSATTAFTTGSMGDSAIGGINTWGQGGAAGSTDTSMIKALLYNNPRLASGNRIFFKGTVNDAASTTTRFRVAGDLNAFGDDFHNDLTLQFYSGNLRGRSEPITDWVTADDSVYVRAFFAAPTNGDSFVVMTETFSDAIMLSNDKTAADNAESWFDGTGYNSTGNQIDFVDSIGENLTEQGGIPGGNISWTVYAVDSTGTVQIVPGAYLTIKSGAGTLTQPTLANGATIFTVTSGVWDVAGLGGIPGPYTWVARSKTVSGTQTDTIMAFNTPAPPAAAGVDLIHAYLDLAEARFDTLTGLLVPYTQIELTLNLQGNPGTFTGDIAIIQKEYKEKPDSTGRVHFYIPATTAMEPEGCYYILTYRTRVGQSTLTGDLGAFVVDSLPDPLNIKDAIQVWNREHE